MIISKLWCKTLVHNNILLHETKFRFTNKCSVSMCSNEHDPKQLSETFWSEISQVFERANAKNIKHKVLKQTGWRTNAKYNFASPITFSIIIWHCHKIISFLTNFGPSLTYLFLDYYGWEWMIWSIMKCYFKFGDCLVSQRVNTYKNKIR